MRTPLVDAVLAAVRVAARVAVLTGASPEAVTWEATVGALDADRDPLSPPSAYARKHADRAYAALSPPDKRTPLTGGMTLARSLRTATNAPTSKSDEAS